MPIWEKTLLILGLGLPILWLLKNLVAYFFSTVTNTKYELINMGLIFVIAGSFSIGLFSNNFYKLAYLPDVKLQITLDPQTKSNISIEAPKITLGGQDLSASPDNISNNCSINANKLTFADEKPCEITYSIAVSRPNTLQITLPDTENPVLAQIIIRHINHRVDLSEIGGKYIKWTEEIEPDFSPKKIRYPIWTIGIYFLISILFFGIYKISKSSFYTRLHKIFKNNKIYSNLIIIFLFSFIAFFYTAGRLGSDPWKFVDLQSDAANIASFAAAYDHAENFANDAFLSNPANFQAYFTFHILLIRGLGSIFGNYASAFTCLLFPTIMISLFGYYWLGNQLFNNRLLAILLSIISMIPVSLPVYEYYGLSGDILPRSLFQALLPFALVLLHHVIDKPEKWWLCSIVFTSLFYVHPVSGPAWLLALYLSLLFVMVAYYHKVLWKPFFLSLGISILGLIPFVQAFFVPSGGEVYDIPLIKEILNYRLTIQTVSVLELYQQYVKSHVLPNLSMIILWGISITFLIIFFISLCKQVISKVKKSNLFMNNKTAVLLFPWWIAILFAAILIPYLDEIYMKTTGNLPILREIRRNLRYFIPLLWITFFWVINEAIHLTGQRKENNLSKALQTNLLLLCFLISAAYIAYEQPLTASPFQNSIHCIRNGKLFCETPGNSSQKVAFYDQVCNIVQQDEVIFPDPSPAYLGDSLIPRYYCQRSIAYTYKDGSGAGSSSMEFIRKWWNLAQEMETVLPTNESPLDLRVLQIAENEGADYFIFINPDPENLTQIDPQYIIFQNNYGILYEFP